MTNIDLQIIIVQSNRFVKIGGEIMATKDRASKKQSRRCGETSTDATKRTNAKKNNTTKACN